MFYLALSAKSYTSLVWFILPSYWLHTTKDETFWFCGVRSLYWWSVRISLQFLKGLIR